MPVSTPGKICVKGNIIFLNDLDKGVHVIDNSNPAQPRKIAFINIPGNEDIAVTVRWGDYKQMDVAGGDEGNDGGAEEEEKQGDAGNPPKAKTIRINCTRGSGVRLARLLRKTTKSSLLTVS